MITFWRYWAFVAVHGVEMGPEQLVERHPRARARRGGLRPQEDAMSPVARDLGVGRPVRPADAVVQVEVPVDGLRAGGAELWKRKFEAAAITPGRAKRCQNGTEPSAKSIQAVPLLGRPHGPAASAGRAEAAKQTIAMTPARTAPSRG